MVAADLIPSALRHSFAILDAVAQGGPAGSEVAAISALTGCHPRTVYRHVAFLRRLGMIEAAIGSGPRYRLGPGIAALALQSSDQAIFLRMARRFAQEAGDRTSLPVHVTVFDHGTVVTVASAAPILGSQKLSPSVLGSRRAAHASASGKVFLANSPTAFRSYVTRYIEPFTDHTISSAAALERECAEVKERGFATDNQEFLLGVTCLAVPVWGANQRVVGTLSLTTPKTQSVVRRREELLAQLLPTAAEFSASIGGRAPSAS